MGTANTRILTIYNPLFHTVNCVCIYTSNFARFSYCPLIHLRKQSGACRRPNQSSGWSVCEAPPKLCMCRSSALPTFLKVTFWFSNGAFRFVVKLKLENCSKEQYHILRYILYALTLGKNEAKLCFQMSISNSGICWFLCCSFANGYIDMSLHTSCMHRWDFCNFLELQTQNGKLECRSSAFVVCIWIHHLKAYIITKFEKLQKTCMAKCTLTHIPTII